MHRVTPRRTQHRGERRAAMYARGWARANRKRKKRGEVREKRVYVRGVNIYYNVVGGREVRPRKLHGRITGEHRRSFLFLS